MEFAGAATPLAAGDVVALAVRLRCEPAAVWAVCDVESAGGGFLPDKRPKILYEAHIFGRLTRHRWDATHPNVSAPSWNRALYGAPGAHQYDRLDEAIGLDRAAALQSASWGMFQIVGMNFAVCGFKTVEGTSPRCATAKARSLPPSARSASTKSSTRRCAHKTGRALRSATTGRAKRQNDYDAKLAAAYRRRKAMAGAAS